MYCPIIYDGPTLAGSGQFKMASCLLLLVILCIGLDNVSAGRVNTTSQKAVEGNTASITCAYSLADDEVLEYIYIDTYVRNRGFVDMVRFYANGSTEYAPFADPIRNRTTLIVREDSVVLRYDYVLCEDFGEYYCNLQTNKSYSYKWMMLAVRGPTAKPSIMLTRQSGCYHEGDDVEAACVGTVGSSGATFQWHGYRSDNTTIELTHLADPGPPYRADQSCSFKRASHIKFNFTAADDAMVLRCVIADEEAGIVPNVADECGEFCSDSHPIHLKRPPAKPIVSSFRRNVCPGQKVSAVCYGEIGGPTGHFKWYKHLEGQAPVDISSIADPGAPYQLHQSCQYERASMISVTPTSADDGMVLRCVVYNHDAGVSSTPTGVCQDQCSETGKITVKASCAAPPSKTPKPKTTTRSKPTSGATTHTVLISTFILSALFLMFLA